MRTVTTAAIAVLAALPGPAAAQGAALEGVEYRLLEIAPSAAPDTVAPANALPEYFINKQIEATHARAPLAVTEG